MERRQFFALTGVSLTSVTHQWLSDPARVAASVNGRRVTPDVVAEVERQVEAWRRLDDKMGGGDLLAGIRENLRLVVGMLKKSSYTQAVGQRLHGLAAEFCRLAGWVAYDNNELGVSQRYYLTGLQNAHIAADRAIGANILCHMSITACSSSPQDGVDLARSALHVKDAVTPAVAGSAYLQLVEASGRAGDRDTVRRARDEAAELLARSTTNPDEEPPWIYWFNEAFLAGVTGEAELAAGNYHEAEQLLRRAAGLFGPDFPRDRALFLCALARARLGVGSVEHACATASEAATVIRKLNSTRDRRSLADVRQALTPYRQTATVRDFDARHSDLLT